MQRSVAPDTALIASVGLQSTLHTCATTTSSLASTVQQTHSCEDKVHPLWASAERHACLAPDAQSSQNGVLYACAFRLLRSKNVSFWGQGH